MTTILALSGSLRRGSFNTALANAAVELAPDGVTVRVATLHGIPLYDGDVEAELGVPEPVVALGDRLRAANGILLVSPEYNYGMPGVMKNGLDWLSRLEDQPFARKPVAIMGASPGRFGTARMQYQLRQVLVHFDARVINKPEVMVGGATSLFDADGQLTDAPTRRHVTGLLAALAAAI